MQVERYGLDTWADDLRRAAVGIDEQVKKVTGRTCLEIKKHAQGIVRGHKHLPGLARSFSYDVTVKATEVVGEVGAVIGKAQGALDHIIENGTLENAPIPHWRPAADKQVPLWQKYLDDAAVEALGDR